VSDERFLYTSYWSGRLNDIHWKTVRTGRWWWQRERVKFTITRIENESGHFIDYAYGDSGKVFTRRHHHYGVEAS
jgi:hypothetical protein